MLRRIFGPKRDGVRGEWRKLHNEELKCPVLLTHYCSGDQIEKNEMDGAYITYGESRGVCRILVGKHERKRLLGRTRPRWDDNIKMELQEVRCGGHRLDRFGSG